jgi:hypothetical protein
MTRFRREGHYRTGPYGDSHWVEGHWVERADWDRSTYQPAPVALRPYRPRLTYESFTRPTSCSLCGAKVYFYQSPYGGKVFFNKLGQPWPKHIETCPAVTHEATRSAGTSANSLTSPERIFSAPPDLPWDADEWRLVRIDKILREDTWYVLKCKTLENEELVRALVPDDPGDLARLPASLSPWSAEGFAVMLYLEYYGDPHEMTVCKYSDFVLLNPNEIEVPTQFSKTRS